MNRTFKLTTVALTSALALGLVAAQAQAESITAVSWGGAYTKSQIKAYHEPFTAMTGITVQSEDYNGGLAEVKAQVEAGNVIWDLVDVELSAAAVVVEASSPLDELQLAAIRATVANATRTRRVFMVTLPV